jgi:hypothetical protein
MNPLLTSVLLVTGGLWFLGCRPSGSGDESALSGQTKQRYHCPMHPTYIRDKAGDCGICGMKLVLIREGKVAAKPTVPAVDDLTAHIAPGQFYCPMHTEVVRAKSEKCPHCGMNLVEKQVAPVAPEGHPMDTSTAPVPGRIRISLSADKRQMIGLAFSKVERRELTRTIRTTAVVKHDETRYVRIAPRYGGWVRRLHVNFTGAPIEKGQPLFTVYSPELFSGENDYLLAWRALQQLARDASAEQRNAATNLLGSARRRLELWEIGEDEIRSLEQRGSASDEMVIPSPITGHVVTKMAVEGKAFMAGESLYEVADLSHLWLDAWVFESDLPLMRPGLQGRITFPYLSHEVLTCATDVPVSPY